jgi:hypothetical protein
MLDARADIGTTNPFSPPLSTLALIERNRAQLDLDQGNLETVQ